MEIGISPRILIVDDDEEIIEAISTRLRAAGYDCVTADNGEDGFSRFQAGDIDLVITDVIMPASDGFNMTEWIRQVSDVPIIVLTAYEQCREPFLHDFPEIKFLTKPYHSDGLLRMVEVELSGRNKTTIKIKRSNHGKTKDSNR